MNRYCVPVKCYVSDVHMYRVDVTVMSIMSIVWSMATVIMCVMETKTPRADITLLAVNIIFVVATLFAFRRFRRSERAADVDAIRKVMEE